jgi:hypothetical protein
MQSSSSSSSSTMKTEPSRPVPIHPNQSNLLVKSPSSSSSPSSTNTGFVSKSLEQLSGLDSVWGVCEENNEQIRSPAPLPAHASPLAKKKMDNPQKDMLKNVLKRKIAVDHRITREGSASPIPKRSNSNEFKLEKVKEKERDVESDEEKNMKKDSNVLKSDEKEKEKEKEKERKSTKSK